MIVVDTSAWIEFLRQTESRADRTLTRLMVESEEIAVTELVFAELVAGARSPGELSELREMLLGFSMLSLAGLDGYEEAADLFRICRAGGEAVASLTDCLVAVPAIQADAPVLHADREFEKLARHTRLRTVKLDA